MGIWNGFWDRVKKIKSRFEYGIAGLFSDDPVDGDFFDRLEEHLLAGDVGVSLCDALLDDLKDYAKREKISKSKDLKAHFAQQLTDTLCSTPLMGAPLSFDNPVSVVLLIGVNGNGKTTTAAKLALILKKQGCNVILAAADTFRAAAVEQLKIWGERTATRVIAQDTGSDSAAVVFDAIGAAKAANEKCEKGGGGQKTVVIADTAGRLHTKHNLMEELAKIYRISKRELSEEAITTILVIDAVTGQNGLLQAKTFSEAFPVSGVILTKFDNTAKGGILLSIASMLNLPVRYVGLGEKEEDMTPFNPRAFVLRLLGEENGEDAQDE